MHLLLDFDRNQEYSAQVLFLRSVVTRFVRNFWKWTFFRWGDAFWSWVRGRKFWPWVVKNQFWVEGWMGRVTCRVLSWVKNRKNSKKINKMQLHVYRKSIIFSFFSSLFFFPRRFRESVAQSTCQRNSAPAVWLVCHGWGLACCPRGVPGAHRREIKPLYR